MWGYATFDGSMLDILLSILEAHGCLFEENKLFSLARTGSANPFPPA